MLEFLRGHGKIRVERIRHRNSERTQPTKPKQCSGTHGRQLVNIRLPLTATQTPFTSPSPGHRRMPPEESAVELRLHRCTVVLLSRLVTRTFARALATDNRDPWSRRPPRPHRPSQPSRTQKTCRDYSFELCSHSFGGCGWLNALRPNRGRFRAAACGLQAEFAQRQVDLGDLGRFRCHVVALEVCAAVGPRRVQEQLDEVVGLVVVGLQPGVCRARMPG